MKSRVLWTSTFLGCWGTSFIQAITLCQGRTKGWRRGTSAWPNRKSISSHVKNYILDTNVLLHDPNSILSFEDNSVIIPIEDLEEIDRFKRESTELGQNARQVSRMLDGFRAQGRLSDGVNLPNGGRLQI